MKAITSERSSSCLNDNMPVCVFSTGADLWIAKGNRMYDDWKSAPNVWFCASKHLCDVSKFKHRSGEPKKWDWPSNNMFKCEFAQVHGRWALECHKRKIRFFVKNVDDLRSAITESARAAKKERKDRKKAAAQSDFIDLREASASLQEEIYEPVGGITPACKGESPHHARSDGEYELPRRPFIVGKREEAEKMPSWQKKENQPIEADSLILTNFEFSNCVIEVFQNGWSGSYVPIYSRFGMREHFRRMSEFIMSKNQYDLLMENFGHGEISNDDFRFIRDRYLLVAACQREGTVGSFSDEE